MYLIIGKNNTKSMKDSIPKISLPILVDLFVFAFFVVVWGLVLDRLGVILWFSEWELESGKTGAPEMMLVFLFACATFVVVTIRRTRELSGEVEQKEQAKANYQHIAWHDSLTNLPNRRFFAERLNQELARAQRHNEPLAVMMLDLDHFKQINDLYGHPAGDTFLGVIGGRLEATMRDMDTVARLGGDEFAILIPGVDDQHILEEIADRIITTLGQRVRYEEHDLPCSTSMGVVRVSGASDAEEIMRCADIALYRAKESGRGTYRFFEPEMQTELVQRRALALDLERAIRAGSLELYFQPIFKYDDTLRTDNCTVGRHLIGFEALTRWNHAELGEIPAEEFIRLAEESNLIIELGNWILEEACRVAANWPEPLLLAVNISALQLMRSSVAAIVRSALHLSGLPVERLELEVTEAVFIDLPESGLESLFTVKELGVRIVLDDFGTGYSSINHLRRFPFAKVKFDHGLLADLAEAERGSEILSAMLALCHALGTETAAEGVETEAALKQIEGHSCGQVQGFLLGPPMPTTGLDKLLDARVRSRKL